MKGVIAELDPGDGVELRGGQPPYVLSTTEKSNGWIVSKRSRTQSCEGAMRFLGQVGADNISNSLVKIALPCR